MLFKKKDKETSSSKPIGNKASFWGASDRMISCEGIECDSNEFNVTSNPKLKDGLGYVCTLEITVPNDEQGLFIHCFYSGHWSFAVSPSNESSDDLPNWKIDRVWGLNNAHSETLSIYCPDGAKVDVIDRIE